MCGICGYIDYKGEIEDHVINNMISSIRHRGPDDQGVYVTQCQDARIIMGHVRLSVLDLSPAGHQPMHYNGLTIVFNGEVYNFKEIRNELIEKGHHFVSNSDTEVILHSFKEWHTDCVSKFIGMFAFVIYDYENSKLYLCRDRAGVKPLYYYVSKDLFVFASELKPLMEIPQFKRRVSLKAVSSFLKTGFIPGEMCIFDDTYKLDGGYWAEYNIEQRELKKWKYWNIDDFYAKPKLKITYEDAKDELKKLFKSAFGYRLVSDVPIGVLLSGGFDSSIVTSILTKELGVTPRTFTIGFHDGTDEAPDAEQISAILGTQHTTHYCSEKDIIDFVPLLPDIYDEPFSDASALPSLVVSKIVREEVPVVLSADGGDEIFAGYDWYDRLARYYPYINKMPKYLRHHILRPVNVMNHILPEHFKRTKNLLMRMENMLIYENVTPKIWYDNMSVPNQTLVNTIFPQLVEFDYRLEYEDFHICDKTEEYALLTDWKTRMKDEYLIKVDRAMMSVSLEGREPLLDHRIIEFAAQLPWDFKYKDGIKKRILKDIVYDYLPKSLMNKPKRGFSPPIARWMRNELQDYINGQLELVSSLGIQYNAREFNKIYDRFICGDNNDYYFIWTISQLIAWGQKYTKNNVKN